MPTVELPDGTQIEFPEGTDQATINRVSAETWAKINTTQQPKSADSGATTIKDTILGQSGQDRLRKEADKQVAAEYRNSGFGYDLADSARNMAQGVPILGGLVDEALAGVSSLMGGDYNKDLEYWRARDRLRSSAFPESTMAQQVAGGISGALLAAPAVGLGSLGVNSARPLAQRAVVGAAIGAPVGAADAFARGEGGAENRAQNSLIGGLIGGVTGGLAPVVGQGISSAYQNVRNFLTPAASFRRLGVSQPVGEELADRLGPDLGSRGAARIRAAGPNGMVADAGPNASGVLDAVIQKGGPGAGYAGEQVTQRMQAGNQQLRQALDSTFGPAVGVTAQRTAIREGTEAARDAAYRAAYAAPIDYSTPQGAAVQRLWARVRPAVRNAANNLLHDEGLPQIADDALPDIRQIDYVTRALNDVAESAEGRGALGGVTNQGRIASSLAQQLRSAARDAVPEYGVALDTAADPIRQSIAVRLGSRLLRKDFTRADLAEELAGITSAPERQAVISGLRAQLDEMMASVRGLASDPNVDARQINEMMRNLTSQTNREKVAMVLGDPAATMRFFREAGQAFRSAELRAAVSTNSRTAARRELMSGMDERFKPGPVGTAMQGDLPGAAKKAIQIATGATPRQQRQLNNEQWLELARALTGRRGRAAEQFLRQLQAAATARAAASARGRALGVAGAGTVAGSNPAINEMVN